MSGSLPQLQTFQLPDVGGVVSALQGLELNRMRAQQLMGAEQERNNLRAVFADPNFNPSSPDAAARILRAAPNTGAQVFNALTAGQREQRQAQTALTESELKHIELGQALLRPVRELPEAERPRAYATWLAGMERRIPGFSNFAPREYSDAGYYTLLAKASEIVAGNRPATPVVTQVPGMPPFLTDPRTGITRPATEAGAPPPAAPSVATPPGQTAAAPRSQSTDPLVIDAAIRRNEGTGRNPASSAVGPYQFVDSTFVDQFRRNFPDIARNLPPEQILTFRGAQLPDGRRVEDVMGPALTMQNQESLARAGFAPSAGNTYLAHFLGAGGAQAVLRADPNTPISQLVSPEAIRANPSILGVPGVTAGQIVQWANNTIDVGPRDARQRLSSGNAMAPRAAPANAMLAPPDATAVTGMPQLPTFAPPRTLAEADYQKRMMDAVAELEKKRIDADRARAARREDAPAIAAETGMTAGATARAQAEVRGSLPPPPAGYRYNQDFTAIEPVPGSPQAQAVTERRGAQVTAANVVTRDIDRILERLNTAVLPVTGMTAPTMAALVAGSPAADVAELRKTIEGNISFSKLNELRQQSPTGGALGNVTDKDLELLKTTLGSLNQNQSPRQFRENLLNLRNAFMEVIHGPNFRDVAPPPPQEPAPERLPGRRGAPPSGNRPTLEQFLERARPANPNASVEDLTTYYNRTYGGR